MIKKSITFTNFNGEEVTEDFYFNFTKAECMKMELGTVGGFSKKMLGLLGKNSTNVNDGQTPVIDQDNVPQLIQMFEDVILNAYGKKSADGKSFIKNAQLKEEFRCSEAYSVLFMELINDSDAASKFIAGVFPNVSDQKPALEQK